jgi:phage shock protein A
MKVALIKRISRLFTADMHAVLDQLEEPELVLRQAIREMEEELARQIQRGKWLTTEIELSAKRIEELEAACADFDGKLDTCFEHGNEALARKLTRRKLETHKLIERLGKRRAKLADQLAEIDTTIESNRGQLDTLRQKAELFATERPSTADARHDEVFAGVDDDEVEIAFLREKQARATS